MDIKNLKVYKKSKLVINNNLIVSLIGFGFTIYFSLSLPFYRQNVRSYNLQVTEVNDYYKKTYNEYINESLYKDKANTVYFYDKWIKEDNIYKRNIYKLLLNDIDINVLLNTDIDLLKENIILNNIEESVITSNEIPDSINEERKIIIYNLDKNDYILVKESEEDNMYSSLFFTIAAGLSTMYYSNYLLDKKNENEKRL